MLQSVSQAGTSLGEKDKKHPGKKQKKMGPFQYFLITSSVLILVMWSVIIFGGRPAPMRTADFTKNERVFLFMVNGALARYAHYEGTSYPKKLADLIPDYLFLRQTELLNELTYKRDRSAGYRLSLTNPKKGEMRLVLSPSGIEHTALGSGEST